MVKLTRNMGFEPRRSVSNSKKHRCINCLGKFKVSWCCKREGTGREWQEMRPGVGVGEIERDCDTSQGSLT